MMFLIPACAVKVIVKPWGRTYNFASFHLHLQNSFFFVQVTIIFVAFRCFKKKTRKMDANSPTVLTLCVWKPLLN